MNATDMAAWLGAVTGTTSLFWDIFKWSRSGPKLRILANPDMVPTATPPGYSPDARWTLVRVFNVGATKTTIMTLSVEIYHSRWAAFRRDITDRLAVLHPWPNPLPKSLDVGEEWSTIINPDPRLDNALEKGLLYAAVEHVHSRKVTRVRVLR